MSNIGCLLSGLHLLLNLSVKYNRICADGDRKSKTIYFGVYSIITSVFCAGLFLLCVWGVLAMMNAMDSAGIGQILMWVFVVIVAGCAIFLFLEYIFGGLMGVIYQFRCNRHPIGYIALALYVLITVAMGAGVFLIIGAVTA